MEQKTFEGKWEDVAHRGPELAGRRVRVTVLEEFEPTKMLDSALAGLIAEADRLSGELPPLPDGLDPPDAWAEGVSAKFRRQGFKL
jgi:hypothetical protein